LTAATCVLILLGALLLAPPTVAGAVALIVGPVGMAAVVLFIVRVRRRPHEPVHPRMLRSSSS